MLRSVVAECDMRPLRIIKSLKLSALATGAFAGSAKEYLKVWSTVKPRRNSERHSGLTAQFHSSRLVIDECGSAILSIVNPYSTVHSSSTEPRPRTEARFGTVRNLTESRAQQFWISVTENASTVVEGRR